MESTPFFSMLAFNTNDGRANADIAIEEHNGTRMMMMSFCRNNSINTLGKSNRLSFCLPGCLLAWIGGNDLTKVIHSNNVKLCTSSMP